LPDAFGHAAADRRTLRAGPVRRRPLGAGASTIVGTERWIGLPHDPTQNGVSVMLEHNPHIPVHRLPVSWRLPLSAAPTIARALTRSPTSPPDW
ncbi:hypothetical protein ABPY43_50020, partial [Streptomyces sp. Mo3]